MLRDLVKMISLFLIISRKNFYLFLFSEMEFFFFFFFLTFYFSPQEDQNWILALLMTMVMVKGVRSAE